MDVDEVTVGQLKELKLLLGGESPAPNKASPFKVGHCYLIRCVTHYQLGRVQMLSGGFVTLQEASWIPATGRLTSCLKDGTVEECEPANNGIIYVSLGAVVDVFDWPHALPQEQK